MAALKIEMADPDYLRFQPVRRTSQGNNIVYVGYGPNPGATNKVDLQLPPCTMPFPIDDKHGSMRLNLDDWDKVNSDGYYASARLASFDEKVIREAVERSWDWFGKRLTEKEIRSMYKPLMVASEVYGPSLKLKTNADTVYFEAALAPKRITANEIPRRAIVRTIFRPAYVHFMVGPGGPQFGLTLLVRQLAVVGTGETQTGDAWMFVD